MTENEKLRALLAEARVALQGVAAYDANPDVSWTLTKEDCRDALDCIDAALAEPVENWKQSAEIQEQFKLAAMKERDEARAEVERLRGITPELPPRPPDGAGLPRYGLRWNGPTEPVAVPMLDGYWTPWHLTDAEAQRFEIERKHTGRALDEAVALQRAACDAAYRRGAEAMREAAMGAAWHSAAMGLYKKIQEMPLPEDKP